LISIGFAQRTGALEHLLPVGVVGRAFAVASACGVRQRVDSGVFQRANQACGHLCGGLPVRLVDACQHKLGGAQHPLRRVQAPVGQDVDLNRVQQVGTPTCALVELLDCAPSLLERLAAGELVRVVGNREVLVAQRVCRLRHRFERVQPVRPVGVALQVAANVAKHDEAWQSPCSAASTSPVSSRRGGGM
jgi:hypothetical protein